MARSRRKRPQGFSGPITGLFTRPLGIAQGDKRQFFNDVSGAMVMSAAAVGAFTGFVWLGWIGGIIGFFVAGSLMAKFVVRGRFHR
jgi:hypothetical protein